MLLLLTKFYKKYNKRMKLLQEWKGLVHNRNNNIKQTNDEYYSESSYNSLEYLLYNCLEDR